MENDLKKKLSFIDVFSLAAGAMISSGIFILPGLAYSQAGPAVIFAYTLAGLLALTGVLSVAELSTAMPRAGGDYYYVNRSMGPLFGTISGLMSWFALSLKTAFAIFGIAEVIFLLTGFNVLLASVIVCVLFMILNIVGVKEAAKLEVALVVILLGLMVAFIVLGAPTIELQPFRPFAPHGFNSILLTAGFVFVSFGGLLKITSVAEEVVNPQKNIPLGMITAVLVVTLIYAGLLTVMVGVLPSAQFSSSLTPMADAAKVFTGDIGFYAITIAAILAFITTANAGIMSASRYPMALSRDNLLPQFISVIHHKFETPVRSVLLTGCFIILALFLPLEILVKSASAVVLTSYVLANFAIIILRESRLQNYRPSFRAPFYPWIQIFSILIFSFLIIDMGIATVEISVGLLMVSMLIYLFYGMRKANKESAWLHLVARIGSKELDSYDLESELKGIIHSRDEIVQDRFDEVVSRALVMDLDEPLTKEALFVKVGEILNDRLPIDKDLINQLLLEREAESSTALIPTVAIPHIMLYGEKMFEIVLIRSKHGIVFSKDAPKVESVFVIAGSRDERRLHLQALAAIAQTIHSPEFKKRWEWARKEEHLRDVFLLSDRKRFET